MRLHRHKFKEAGFFQNGEHTSRFADSSEFSEKGSSSLRIGLVLLSFLLMTLAVEFEFGAAFPLNIISGLRSKHPAASSHAPGSILWSADMETGNLSQWSWPDVPGGPNAGGGVFDSGTATASVDVASLAHSGTHSAKKYVEGTK
jgi:hypothetical protein